MPEDALLVNRYQIREVLSQKLGRSTFLAQDSQAEKLIVIKTLCLDHNFRWDDLKLFEREAATLKNLDCPEIPTYLDFFEADIAGVPSFALVQSYIDAPSLDTHIAAGRRFSEAEVIELADRLLQILEYLHQQHPPVIHRDIKPSNILLTNRSGNSVGDVYLVDFGSVQAVAKKEEGTITIVGSYGYMPIEQFGGQTTMVSDLYSLGMTMSYLLTGIHPAEMPQVNGVVSFKDANISLRLKRWLEKMTHHQLNRRYESAAQARTALLSKNGSYGDFQNLRPSNTKIRLERDHDQIRIIWLNAHVSEDRITSMAGWAGGSIVTVVAIANSSPSIFAHGILGLFFVLLVLACFSFPLGYGMGTYISGNIIKLLHWVGTDIRLASKKYELLIDGEHFRELVESKQILNYDRLQLETRQDDESGETSGKFRNPSEILIYNPGYTFAQCLDANRKLIAGATITTPPQLHFYCGNFNYSFPEFFSSQELWWLAKELSDFLNLELQVVYPTPQIPDAPAPTACGGC